MLYPIELWAGKTLLTLLAFLVVAATQLPPGPLLALVRARGDVEALVGRVVFKGLEAHAVILQYDKRCSETKREGWVGSWYQLLVLCVELLRSSLSI